MKRLIIDVSTNIMYLGLTSDYKLIDFSIRYAEKDHAKYLVDRISTLINNNNLTLDDINEVIVGIGPGSYTGLRIGLMVAKMLCYVKGIKLRRVSSLFLLSSGYHERVSPAIDARRKNVFCAIYDGLEIIKEDQLRQLDEFVLMSNNENSKLVLINESTYKIDARKIIDKSEIVEDVMTVVPSYLRKTEAESKHD